MLKTNVLINNNNSNNKNGKRSGFKKKKKNDMHLFPVCFTSLLLLPVCLIIEITDKQKKS